MSESGSLTAKRRAHMGELVNELGQQTLDALRLSVDCLERHDTELAARIVAADSEINCRRRVLEQECLVSLAAYKPAGKDLRALGSCLELASELERIGDYAADVARILLKAPTLVFPAAMIDTIAQVAREAIAMLEAALQAFLSESGEQEAREAIAAEAQVDRDEDAFVQQVLERMQAESSFVTAGTYLLWIAHNYERVADRATNVAERAIYVASGSTPELNT